MPHEHPTDAESPFAQVEALRSRLRRRAREEGIDWGAEQLLQAADAVRAAHDYFAEMQLGAEGFDNMDSARTFGEQRESMLRAAEHIVAACRALLRS